MQAGRRRHHLEEGERDLQRDAHAQLAQDQVHPAAGIRDRRLVGKRQAPRLPLIAPRRKGRAQAHLCRQGRHRLHRRADRGADGADGAARGRQGAGRGAASRPQGRALDQAQARRRDRLCRIHRRRHPAPPELHRAARGQAGIEGGARSAQASQQEREEAREAQHEAARPPRTSGSKSAARTG